MGKAIIVATPTSGGALASGEECNLFGYRTESTTEVNSQASCTEGATFSRLAFRVNSGGSGTNTMTFRDAGANGNQTCSVAGTGIAEDTTNTDVLTAADLFNLAYTDTGTNSTHSWIKANVEFASGHGAFHGAFGAAGQVFDAASATRFIGLSQEIEADGTATEADVAWKCRGYDVFEALQVRVLANARTNNSVFRNRINGANGTGVITFAAGATGLVEDTGLADAISDGQTICASLELLTGVEDLTVSFVVATLKSTASKQDIWLGIQNGAVRTASATAHYVPIGGNLAMVSPTFATTYTEAQCQIKPGFAGTASNLRAYCSANTYTGNGTVKLYQNGSPVITLTITASGGAAWYENTADSVTFSATDVFSYEFDEGTANSAEFQMVGMTLALAASGNTASPGKGTIVFSGKAPTGAVTAHKFSSPNKGSIVFSGKTPTVVYDQTVRPDKVQITFSGKAPALSVTDHDFASPDKGSIVFSGKAPAAAVTENRFSSPEKGSIVFSGKQPSALVGGGQLSAPDPGQIVFAGKAPAAVTTAHVTKSPAQGEIVFSGKAPQVGQGQSASPNQGVIVFAGKQPSVTITQNVWVTPDFGLIQFTGHAPEVAGGEAVVGAVVVQAGVRKKGRRKRLRILPDGKLALADDFELQELLRLYQVERIERAPRKKKKGVVASRAIPAPEIIAQMQEEADVFYVMKEIARLM